MSCKRPRKLSIMFGFGSISQKYKFVEGICAHIIKNYVPC